MSKVYIVAGGPGDPELITIKGSRIIKNADVIFRGKRFSPDEMFADKKVDCQIYEYFDSTYEEKLEIIKSSIKQNKTVVFLNMGDPCLFGMISGLTDRLEKANIEYEIVPGVSAYNASCAIIKKQMTGLGIPNTAICTTYKDNIDGDAHLEQIAALGASVALFMSVKNIEQVCAAFRKCCPNDTPVAVISDASRPSQMVNIGNLQTISAQVKESGIEDGIILIGEFINKPFDYEAEKRFQALKQSEQAARLNS